MRPIPLLEAPHARDRAGRFGRQRRLGQSRRAGEDGRARRLPRRLLHRIRRREPGALPAHGARHRAGAGRLGDHQLLPAPSRDLCPGDFVHQRGLRRTDGPRPRDGPPTLERAARDRHVQATHRAAQLRRGDAGRDVGRPQPLHRRAAPEDDGNGRRALRRRHPQHDPQEAAAPMGAGAPGRRGAADGRQDHGQDLPLPRLRAVRERRGGPRGRPRRRGLLPAPPLLSAR